VNECKPLVQAMVFGNMGDTSGGIFTLQSLTLTLTSFIKSRWLDFYALNGVSIHLTNWLLGQGESLVPPVTRGSVSLSRGHVESLVPRYTRSSVCLVL
jgi:hypothetical protein